MRWGMVIDLKRCIGCYACQLVVQGRARHPAGCVLRARAETGGRPVPDRAPAVLPVLCNHCEEAPCVEACPTGASFKWEEDGIVDIDQDLCVGCRSCMMACPYTNRYYNDSRSTTSRKARRPMKRRAGAASDRTW